MEHKNRTATQNQNKKRKNIIPTPVFHLNPDKNEPLSQPTHPTVTCSNNIKIMISLAQMRHSNGRGSVRNNEIFFLFI